VSGDQGEHQRASAWTSITTSGTNAETLLPRVPDRVSDRRDGGRQLPENCARKPTTGVRAVSAGISAAVNGVTIALISPPAASAAEQQLDTLTSSAPG